MFSFPQNFSYPKTGFLGFILNKTLNNSWLKKVKKTINKPFNGVVLKSDIKNVVYLNWMIPIEKIEHLIPEDFVLENWDGHTVLSVLTYEHGNFGPKFIKYFRKILGSPLQSNWRLYLDNCNEKPTVLFLSNIMNSLLYTVGSRTFSNIMETHYPLKFEHTLIKEKFTTTIVQGKSNSPELQITAEKSLEWQLPKFFEKIAKNPIDVVKKIAVQDYAINIHSKTEYCLSEIFLNFEINDIKPLKIKNIKSSTLENIIKDYECFAFAMPGVEFNVLNEKMCSIK